MKMNRQSGQVLIFGVIIIVFLLLAILLVFDTQSMIRSKVKIQTAAEASALTAAKWQKESLNLIGEINLIKGCDVLTAELGLTSGASTAPEDQAAIAQLRENINNLTVMQGRLMFAGPMLGFGAAQLAAKNNGINISAETAADLNIHIRHFIEGIYDEQPDEVGGYYWKEYYPRMLQAVADSGIAVVPNAHVFGLNQVAPDFLSYYDFYEAVIGENWCNYLLLELIKRPDSYFSGQWWKPSYSEVTFPEESTIFSLYVGFAQGYASGDDDNFIRLASERGLEPLATEHLLLGMEWCRFESGWSTTPDTRFWNNNTWLGADLKDSFMYGGARAATYCRQEIPTLSRRRGIAPIANKVQKGAEIGDSGVREEFLHRNTYNTNPEVRGRALAKPIGAIGDEPPQVSGVVLPVFSGATIIPSTMFRYSFLRFEYSALEKFIKWLATVDSLYEIPDDNPLPANCENYLKALQMLDKPDFRKKGYNHAFNESEYNSAEFENGDYKYSSSNSHGAGWLQQACSARIVINGNGDFIRQPTDPFNRDDENLITGIRLNNEEGICATQYGSGGGGGGPVAPPVTGPPCL